MKTKNINIFQIEIYDIYTGEIVINNEIDMPK